MTRGAEIGAEKEKGWIKRQGEGKGRPEEETGDIIRLYSESGKMGKSNKMGGPITVCLRLSLSLSKQNYNCYVVG